MSAATTSVPRTPVLPAAAARVTAALAQAFVPSAAEGGPPLDPASPAVLAGVAASLATLPWEERLGAHVLLRALRYAPFVFGPARGRLDRLPVAARRATLERMRTSRLGLVRYLLFCVKGLVAMAYYARPEVWPAIGYDGPYLGRIDVTVLSPPPLARGPLPSAPPPPRSVSP